MLRDNLQDELYKVFSKFSDRIAIRYRDSSIKYSELDQKSNVIASYILQQGIKPHSFISILVEDRVEVISLIIGILKARCIFVPLDSSYPSKRLEYMIASTDTEYLFWDEKNSSRDLNLHTGGNREINKTLINQSFYQHAHLWEVKPIMDYCADDPIYLYFTSGSTGKPKAIIGKNNSLLHFINWEITEFKINQDFRVSQFTSPSFDAFLRDIFVPLFVGGIICIPDTKDIILDTTNIVNWIEETKVNLIHCTPSLFRVISAGATSQGNFKELKYVLMAGEALRPNDLKGWYRLFGERVQLVNLYGSSETTMIKMFYLIKPSDVQRKSIPIGKPMKGAKAIILDKNLNVCNQGDIGEIYIRTLYRTLGYYKNLKLNSEKFIINPFNNDSNDLIYRTGDLGRLLDDGNIEFLGRIDRQIKIRGIRVELGEIEKELINYTGIKECVVDFKKEEKDIDLEEETVFCEKCGIPSCFPEVVFDNNNYCNICNSYETYKDKAKNYFKTIDDLNNMFQVSKNIKKCEYDCVLLYSGGKDSTYVLYKLIDMGLKVLAYTFDNGFISKTTMDNIRKIVRELNVDHVIGTLENMNKIFLDGLREESSVCNGCFKVLRILSTRLAYEKGIKYIVTGLSKGQIFELRLYDIYKEGIFEQKEVEKRIFAQRVLYHVKDDYVSRAIGTDELVNQNILEKVELIDYYRYSDVTKEQILEFLKSKSSYWLNPSDTGLCSSNCMINDVGIYIQRKERGYDNYTSPNSWEVRLGHTTLDEAKNESEGEIDVRKVQDILEALEYDETYKNKNYLNEYLVAYFTSDKVLNANDIRAFLEKTLPGYIIPTYFVRIDKIPLTINGKIAYNALPDHKKIAKKEYVAPRDEIEIVLEKIWCEILGIDKVGINEDFLQIGGHSLNIMQLISKTSSKFNVELPLAEIFRKATIEEIAKFIRTPQNNVHTNINKAETREYYPTTIAQKKMYALSLIKGAGIVQNVLFKVRIKGAINKRRVKNIFKILINRHEILRTHFEVRNNEVVQIVHDNIDFNVNFIKSDKFAIEKLIKELIKPFDPAIIPLFRVSLIEVQKDEHILLLDMHHTISDGMSIGILAEELLDLYEGKKLPQLRMQYKDYALWQQEALKTGRLKKQEDYWTNLLSGELPILNISTDYPKKWIRSYKGDTVTVYTGVELASGIKKLIKENGVTLYMFLLGAFNVLISKYTGQDDIIIGSISARRSQNDLEKMVGMFLNNIVLRSQPLKDKSFNKFLMEVKTNTLLAFENQDYPFEILTERLGVKSNFIENPIFNILFSLQNVPMPSRTIQGLVLESMQNFSTGTSRHDISLLAFEQGNDIKLDFEYCSKLFNRGTIEQMARDYLFILEQVVKETDMFIYDIKLSKNL